MQAKLQKTTIAKKETVEQGWYITSAEGKVLGRMATQIAMVLMGKHRPGYTRHVDTGDFVIVTDAEKVVVSGIKNQTKYYQHYTYYPGGRKVVPYEEMKATKPEKIVMEAVRRMLPKNKLGRVMLSKLKVYRGSEHPHAAQQPEKLELN